MKKYIPNAITLLNLFFGSLATVFAAKGQLEAASFLVFAGIICDFFDGLAARVLKVQSDIGVQLDSLADAITFGAAPAMLVYKWGLRDFGMWGIFVAFLFLAGGVLRLARYNVLSSRKEDTGPASHFLGLPIPAAVRPLRRQRRCHL